MNYFEHHIGDYDQATSHLSACEDGIYSRMIRWYMASESPLPLDLKLIQRRVRAHTKDERAAVETVLAEFFVKKEDGYHQHRCNDEIARYNDKKNKAKGSANARWGAMRSDSERNANAMRPHSEGNAPHTPDTKHQEKDIPASRSSAAAVPADPIFGTGLDFLTRKGIAERSARAFLGLLRKELHDDLVVSELLGEAERQDVTSPQAWLTAAAKRRKANSPVNGALSFGAQPEQQRKRRELGT